MSTIEDRVKLEIARQFGIDTAEVVNTANLANDLGADSLDRIELVMVLEDWLAIEVPDETAEAWTTVQQVIDYAASRTA